ncbi:hypothetical protein [Deinococcus yunweiensis]|uniref:hypothetical protein n=1 Tax=Deinococcus yunweiensis TaxID=367282 RepID=UPI00398EFC43
MNVREALQSIFPRLPDECVLEATPDAPPATVYFVVSEPGDGDRGTLHVTETGHVPQRRVLTLLITLYGKEGQSPTDLRPYFTAVRHQLRGLITEHPGLPPLSRVSLGPVLPPQADPVGRRPYAGVRLLLAYVE